MDDDVKQELKEDHFRVAIFGSARIKKGDPTYAIVSDLSRMIGERGWDVVTGGGPGLMEAGVEGHDEGAKGDAHRIGLRIKLPFEQHASKHLNIREDFDRFSPRLDHFMALSNAVVVAPGGIGTLLELFYAWQLTQVKHTCENPLILLGDMWPGLIEWIKKNPVEAGLISPPDLDFIYCVKNPKEAREILDEANKDFEAGGANFCRNYKKYSL